MIKVVIFDSDGMISHGPRFSDVYSKTYNIPIGDMIPFFGTVFNDCLVGKADLREELQKGWLEKWKWTGTVDEFISLWFSVGDEIDQEIVSAISYIREKGITCVLATNNERRRVEYLIKKGRYNEIFDKIYASGYVGFKKPTYDFFEYIFNDLKKQDSTITKDEIIFWDDDMENVEGAKSFGRPSEHFTDRNSYRNKMNSLITKNYPIT